MSNSWKFAGINHIEDYSFNKVLNNFYGFGIEGLVRENIQNSLDGKLQECNEPVKIKIELGSIKKDEIPAIDEVINRIHSLKGENEYTRKTINHMIKKSNQNVCNYITFEDLNTKGLKDAENCEKGIKSGSFRAYAYNKGVHVVDENSEKEKLRGGSHGIGKIASNAASDLFVMYFANCDEHGNKHLGGNVQLIEHEHRGHGYRATGYFTNENQNSYYPFKNEWNGIFKKEERGLKIIVPFLCDKFNNEDEIIRAVCDSFFLAIIKDSLVVQINEKIIDSKTIEAILKNTKYYGEQNIEEMKKNFTPLYYDTFKNSEVREIKVKDRNKEEYSFNLHFKYDERIQKGRVGVIRTIGMKIEDFKVNNNATKPFNAVLIPNTLKEDEFLKSLENESHTSLEYEHFADDSLRDNAKKFLANLGRTIKAVIQEAMMENNKPDGDMNTDDVLYNTEISFKKDLEKATPVIKVGKGKKGESKNIVQVANGGEKRKSPENTGDTSKPGEGKKRTGEKNRKNKKITKTDADGKKKVFIKVEPSYVSRGFRGNNEVLQLDLSKNKDIKDAKECEISIAVVDGMGVEHLDEFQIVDNYEGIKDSNSGSKLEIKDNAMKNVSMKDGVIRLNASIKKNYNKTLKFVYHIREV